MLKSPWIIYTANALEARVFMVLLFHVHLVKVRNREKHATSLIGELWAIAMILIVLNNGNEKFETTIPQIANEQIIKVVKQTNKDT